MAGWPYFGILREAAAKTMPAKASGKGQIRMTWWEAPPVPWLRAI